MQWLDAESIARDKELLIARIPDSERKHAAQFIDAVLAEVFVEMDNRFCVTVRPEFVALRLQAVTEFGKIINLAVEHDPDRVVLVGHRLAAAFHVENAQATMRQPDAAVKILAT